TCGVEWLAAEKLEVHQSRGLSWGNPDNLVTELASLNRLLADHPCFLDGATVTPLTSDPETAGPVYALSRISAEGVDRVLILINSDHEKPHPSKISEALF